MIVRFWQASFASAALLRLPSLSYVLIAQVYVLILALLHVS